MKFPPRRAPRLTAYCLLVVSILIAACGCAPNPGLTAEPGSTTASSSTAVLPASPTLLPAPKPTLTTSPPGDTPGDTGEIQAQEYTVYAAVIESLYLTADVQQVVVTSQTGISPSRQASASEQRQYLLESLGAKLSNDTLQDYVAKNDHIYTLTEEIPLDATVVYLDQGTFDRIFQSENGWDQFYGIYPGSQGIMTFSRVGFNAAQDQALVYAGNQQNYLAGRGNYILLTKKGGQWAIEEVVMAWIS